MCSELNLVSHPVLPCVGLPPALAYHRNMLGNSLQDRLHVKLQMFSFFY